jgi:hypothetical protein
VKTSKQLRLLPPLLETTTMTLKMTEAAEELFYCFVLAAW